MESGRVRARMICVTEGVGMGPRRLVTAVAVGALVALPLAAMPSQAVADGGYRLIMGTTETGSYPVRWNPCQEAITYTVNTASARQKGKSAAFARAKAQSEVIAAVGRVSAATGIPFRFAGATTEIPRGAPDGWTAAQDAGDEIVIAYVAQGRAATRSDLMGTGDWGLGGQAYAYRDSTVVAGRGFVLLDRDKARRLKPGFGPGLRRGNLVLHELAHVMGLDHISDRAQLMNPTMSSSTPNGFAAGDRAGLTRIGRAAGCVPDAGDFWVGS